MSVMFMFSIFVTLCIHCQASSLEECRKMNRMGSNMNEILQTKLIQEKIAQLRRNADKLLKDEPEDVRAKAIERLRMFVKESLNASFPNSNSFDAFDNPVKTELYMLKDYLPGNLILLEITKLADRKTGKNIGATVFKFYRKVHNSILAFVSKLGFPFSVVGAIFNFGGPTNADVIKHINKGLNIISKQMQTGFTDLSKQMQDGFKGMSNLMVNLTHAQAKLLDSGFRSIEENINYVRNDIKKLKESIKYTIMKGVQSAHVDDNFFVPVASAAKDYVLMLDSLKQNRKHRYERHRKRFIETCQPSSRYNQEDALRYIERQIFSNRMLEYIIGYSKEAGVRDATRFGLSVVKTAIIATQNQIQCLGFDENSLRRGANCELTEAILSESKIFIKNLLKKITVMNIHSLPWGHGKKIGAFGGILPKDKKDLVEASTLFHLRSAEDWKGRITAICAFDVASADKAAAIGFVQSAKYNNHTTPYYAVAALKTHWHTINEGVTDFWCLLEPRIYGKKPMFRWGSPKDRNTNPEMFRGYKNVLIPYTDEPHRMTKFTPCIKSMDYYPSCCEWAYTPFHSGTSGIRIGVVCCLLEKSRMKKRTFLPEQHIKKYSLKQCNIEKNDNISLTYKWLYFKYEI